MEWVLAPSEYREFLGDVCLKSLNHVFVLHYGMGVGTFGILGDVCLTLRWHIFTDNTLVR